MNINNQGCVEQTSHPFFAMYNFICNSHNEDKYNIFMQTAYLAQRIAYMMCNKYSCDDVNQTYQAMVDVYQGESYGVGFGLTEQLDQYLARGKQALIEYSFKLCQKEA